MELNKNGDVGLVEDLVFALKNMIAVEDHSATSLAMSKDKKWIDIIEIVRNIRTKWLISIVKKCDDEHIWCVSKHILASAEGMLEVGNRFVSANQEKEAKEAFNDALKLINLFQVLNDLDKNKGGLTSA